MGVQIFLQDLIYLAALGLHCCAQAFSGVLLFIALCRLLIAGFSVMEHRLQAHQLR